MSLAYVRGPAGVCARDASSASPTRHRIGTAQDIQLDRECSSPAIVCADGGCPNLQSREAACSVAKTVSALAAQVDVTSRSIVNA